MCICKNIPSNPVLYACNTLSRAERNNKTSPEFLSRKTQQKVVCVSYVVVQTSAGMLLNVLMFVAYFGDSDELGDDFRSNFRVLGLLIQHLIHHPI